MGCARLASLASERWDLTFEGGQLIFHESGIMFGGRRVQRALWESRILNLGREGKVRQRRPTAGLIVGAAPTILTAAMHRVCRMMA